METRKATAVSRVRETDVNCGHKGQHVHLSTEWGKTISSTIELKPIKTWFGLGKQARLFKKCCGVRIPMFVRRTENFCTVCQKTFSRYNSKQLAICQCCNYTETIGGLGDMPL